MSIYKAATSVANGDQEIEVPPAIEIAVRAFLNYATNDTQAGPDVWESSQWVVVNNQTSATALYDQTAKPFPDGQPSTVEVVTSTQPNSSAAATAVESQITANLAWAKSLITGAGVNYGLRIIAQSGVVQVTDPITTLYVLFTPNNLPVI